MSAHAQRKLTMAEKIKRALDRLNQGPASTADITKAIGLSTSMALETIAQLRKERRIHLGGWIGGNVAPIWHLGPGDDAPRQSARNSPDSPAAIRESARKAAYRAKVREERRRMAEAAKPPPGSVQRDPWLTAFYGPPPAQNEQRT